MTKTETPPLPLFEPAADTEGEHWYEREGSPAYRILRSRPKKLDDGTTEFYRNTTLRDAKKYKLLRSVTTYLDRLAQPGLERWRTGQLLDAAFETPNTNGVEIPDPKEWKATVLEEAGRISREARETGTLIHGAIERCLEGLDYDPQWRAHIDSAMRELNKLAPGGWQAERVVVGNGYAGKVDAINPSASIIVDFKTQKVWNKKPYVYDEWAMQGAAYCRAAKCDRFANIVLAREDGNKCAVQEWSAADLTVAWQKFDLVRQFVQLEAGL